MLTMVTRDAEVAEAHPLEGDISSRFHRKAELGTPCSDKIRETVSQINVQGLTHQAWCIERAITFWTEGYITLSLHDVSGRAPAMSWVAFGASRAD